MNNRDGVFNLYLADINKIPLLSEEEERDIVVRAHAGDEAAVEELIKKNLRFVVNVAKKYANRGLPLSDLVAEGNEGLVLAARKFDPAFGVRFISYAVWWVRQRITMAISDNRFIRMPFNTNKTQKFLTIVRKKYRDRFGHELSPEVAAELLGMNEATIKLLFHQQVVMSLQTPVYQQKSQSANSELMDYIPSEEPEPDIVCMQKQEQEFKVKQKEILLSLIATLSCTERNKKMYIIYHGLDGNPEPPSLEEVGAMFGVTRERVRQIKENVHKKLKKKLFDLPHEMLEILRGSFAVHAPEEQKRRGDVDEFVLYLMKVCGIKYKSIFQFYDMTTDTVPRRFAMYFMRTKFHMTPYQIAMYFRCLIEEVNLLLGYLTRTLKAGTLKKVHMQQFKRLEAYFIEGTSYKVS